MKDKLDPGTADLPLPGMVFGYRRVSTVDQSLERQDLESLGCSRVFEEKLSAMSADRQEWDRLVETLRHGDKVVIWSIDRLARSLIDLKNKVEEVRKRGAVLEFAKERLTFAPDASDPQSELQLNIIASFAQFEREIMLQRQKEGILKAKAAGKYRGTEKRRDDADIIKTLKMRDDDGNCFTRQEVARKCGVGVATVYRVIADARNRGERI